MESQFTNEQNTSGENKGYEFYTMPTPEEIVVPNPANRRYGLGRSIAATIISVASILFSVVAIFCTLLGLTGVEPELDDLGWSMLAVGIIFTLFGLATAIISIVLGIKSIIAFKKVTPRPIATLILGIGATATAAEGLVVVVMDFIYAFIVFAALVVA